MCSDANYYIVCVYQSRFQYTLETKLNVYLICMCRGWEDWQEESIPIHCLFCEVSLQVTKDVLNHMKVKKGFCVTVQSAEISVGYFENISTYI